jgi:hypothetical protein
MALPLYKLQIDPQADSDLEVNYVALVDQPAIEKDFMAFKDHKMFFANEDRKIISGPAMLADTPIYRNDKNGEYMVVFEKATIEQICQKFFAKGYNQNFNIMHDPNQKTDGVFVFESFITDSARGIKPMAGYEDAPDGSWFISAKIDNEEVWGKIKAGDFKGFSVEGQFAKELVVNEPVVPDAEAMLAALKELFK